MDTQTIHRTSAPTAPFSRTRRLSGGVGSLALVGMGVAHTLTNAVGFAKDPDASWPLFLIFGVGVSLALWVIAVVAWRYSRHGVGRAKRVIVAVAGVLLCLMAVNVLRVHPEIIISPAGPGPWSLIGGPALLTAAWQSRRQR